MAVTDRLCNKKIGTKVFFAIPGNAPRSCAMSMPGSVHVQTMPCSRVKTTKRPVLARSLPRRVFRNTARITGNFRSGPSGQGSPTKN